MGYAGKKWYDKSSEQNKSAIGHFMMGKLVFGDAKHFSRTSKKDNDKFVGSYTL